MRERLRLRPGIRFTVLDKGEVLFLIRERPTRSYRGLVRVVTAEGLRDKRDRV